MDGWEAKLNLIDKVKSKMSWGAVKKEAKCTCGAVLMTMPSGKKDVYFCNSCNKLLYFLESDLEVPNLIPFNLGLFKKE
jgi:hypothetical protein